MVDATLVFASWPWVPTNFGRNSGNFWAKHWESIWISQVYVRNPGRILFHIQKSKKILNVSCWHCFTAGMSFWRPPSVRNPSASRAAAGFWVTARPWQSSPDASRGGWSAAIPDARWMTWKRCGKRWGRLDFRHLGKENGCFVGLFASVDVHNVTMGDIASNWFRLKRRWIGRCWQLLPLCCALAALPQWNSSRAAIASSHWWMRLGLLWDFLVECLGHLSQT